MERVLDILAKETDNSQYIYLYREEGKWCAYEQSACQVSTIIKGCRLEKVVAPTHECILIKAVLEDESQLLTGNCPAYLSVVEQGTENMALKKKSKLDYDIFSYWKIAVVKEKRKTTVMATI